jgi:2-phosphosulfolactate phosphatase
MCAKCVPVFAFFVKQNVAFCSTNQILEERNEMEVIRSRLLEGAQTARGVAVIIDVFRAFTCAPLLFSFGIRKSILVSTPEEAFALRQKNNELLLIGEVDGIPIQGFDLGNSPSEILYRGAAFFRDKTVVQRTSSGVQGVLAALGVADEVLPASYSLAQSTARYILSKQPPTVSLVAMGWALKQPVPEDEWCVRYISHLLGVDDYNHYEALAEILANKMTQKFFDPEKSHFPPEDPIMCLQLNTHHFVLRAGRDDDGVVVNKIDFAHSSS